MRLFAHQMHTIPVEADSKRDILICEKADP